MWKEFRFHSCLLLGVVKEALRSLKRLSTSNKKSSSLAPVINVKAREVPRISPAHHLCFYNGLGLSVISIRAPSYAVFVAVGK